MKKFLLASAAALLSLAASGAVGVTPYPLPENVVSVNPSQGLVDLDNDVNPLGVTQITLNFPSNEIDINRSIEAPICIYRDGEETPDCEIFANQNPNVFVDNMGEPMAAVKFTKTYRDPGLYRVVIPAGVFVYNGTPVDEVELAYEIYIPYEITPVPGTYASVSEWIMTFPDYNEVKVVKNGSFFLNGSASDSYTLKAEVIQEEGVDPYRIRLSLSQGAKDNVTVTTPGRYFLQFPAGAIEMTAYGAQYYEDPTDKVVEYTQSIYLDYYVEFMPKPAISPAEGMVEGFRNFTLEFADNCDFLFYNDMAKGVGIYKVLPDDTLSEDKLYHVVLAGNTLHSATLTLAYYKEGADGEAGEWKTYRSAQNPGPGRYCLHLPDALFSFDYYADELDEEGKPIKVQKIVNSEPRDYIFYISNKPFEAEINPESGSTVDAISDIVMTFPKAENLSLNDACTAEPTVKDENGNDVEGVQVFLSVPGTISPLSDGDTAVGGEEDDDLTIKAYVSLFPEIVGKGTYTVTIPAEKFRSGFELSPVYELTYNVTGVLGSVEELGVEGAVEPAYNVLGQRVDASYKGIVIRGGKKFIRR